MSINIFKTRQRNKKFYVTVFASQKGGVGKSTFAIHYANYCRYHRNTKVVVIDTDPQMSIAKIHEQDMKEFPDRKELYQVFRFDKLDDRTETKYLIEDAREMGCDIIIDSPGNLSMEGQRILTTMCDAMVMPYTYDEATTLSTFDTISCIKKFDQLEGRDKSIDIYFVQNRFNKSVGRKEDLEQQRLIDEELSKYGVVGTKIPSSTELARACTLFTTKKQDELLKIPCATIFDAIHSK